MRIRRDAVLDAAQKALDNCDLPGASAAMTDYNNWKEGGDSRAELHVAGGALIGGLGGGSAFSTIGGATGAGLASKMAGSLNDISKGVASATGSDLIGNLAANIAAGVGGAAVGGTAGAAMASNVHLYNQSVDDERALMGDPGKKSPSLFSLAMQGIANGLGAIVGMGGGVPPSASLGVVLAESTAASAASGKPGYVPSNVTLSSGDNNNADANNNDNSSFWSSTKNKTPVENAYDHSVKHGAEFPENQNSVQYVQSAQDFVNNPPDGALVKTRPNGDTLYYDPATNTFASKNKDGAPKTMFKPNAGMNYWNKQ